MKWTVKLVLCFLIAWLPLTGFAAPAMLCPHGSSMTSSSHVMAQHATPHTTDMHAAGPAAKDHQPACHGSAGNLSCTVLAIPAEVTAPRITSIPNVYALHDSPQFSQFIPDLPPRPPRVL